MEKKYSKFVDELVPFNPANMMQQRGISQINDVDLSVKQPLELDQISEPDDQDIEKMLLTDREKAFKEVYWVNKHKDWIKQDNEKKRAKKAQRKRKELISAH